MLNRSSRIDGLYVVLLGLWDAGGGGFGVRGAGDD